MNSVLVLKSKPPAIPVSFQLQVGTFILGRSSRCDFVVKDETISRRHAEIVQTQRATTVRDLGSRNGTHIENKCVRSGDVTEGQHVRFGSITFVVTAFLAQQEGVFSDSEVETTSCKIPDQAMGRLRSTLSKAQRRVLDLLLQGLGEKKIAAKLNLSSTTIHNHIQAIYRASNVHSRAELLVQLLTERKPNN
jgi:pSer/pThr/pTyr-binding forkhead associated (FHA) protein